MPAERPTLGKLYPKSDNPKELAEILVQNARQHEMQLQTNVAIASRVKALEDRDNKHEAEDDTIKTKLAAIELNIAVGLAKIRGAMWAIGIVWTILLFILGFVLKSK